MCVPGLRWDPLGDPAFFDDGEKRGFPFRFFRGVPSPASRGATGVAGAGAAGAAGPGAAGSGAAGSGAAGDTVSASSAISSFTAGAHDIVSGMRGLVRRDARLALIQN